MTMAGQMSSRVGSIVRWFVRRKIDHGRTFPKLFTHILVFLQIVFYHLHIRIFPFYAFFPFCVLFLNLKSWRSKKIKKWFVLRFGAHHFAHLNSIDQWESGIFSSHWVGGQSSIRNRLQSVSDSHQEIFTIREFSTLRKIGNGKRKCE